MTEPDEALLWARWAMRGYSRPSDVVIPLTAPLRTDGRPLSGVEAHNFTEALAEAYRAGAAASEARIKELEARVAELERRLSGGAGGTPPPTGPAYDPRPIATCFDNGRAMYGGRGGGGQG
jgi:hypothetical protein